MRLLDVNILLYAVDARSPFHERVRTWFEERMSGAETVAFPWHTLTGFVRISTRRAPAANPLTADEALDHVERWLLQPSATVVHPTYRHVGILRDLLGEVGIAGNRVPDAHLAALAIEHGATLCSADEDFGRFPGLNWENPLRA